MKWFQHETNAHKDIKLKKLRKKFGLEGYAIYFIMLEIIGEYANEKNIPEWGYVDRFHDIESLADECDIDVTDEKEVAKFKATLEECNRLDLFQKKNHRLYCEKILKRLDNYAQKVLRKKGGKKPEKEEVRTESVQSTVREEEKREDQKRNLPAENQQEFTKEEFESVTDDLIALLETELETKITNRGKQMKALRMILDAGFTIGQTKKAIVFMAEKDEYFQDKGFDLMTVANQLPRYKAEARNEGEVTT